MTEAELISNIKRCEGNAEECRRNAKSAPSNYHRTAFNAYAKEWNERALRYKRELQSLKESECQK